MLAEVEAMGGYVLAVSSEHPRYADEAGGDDDDDDDDDGDEAEQTLADLQQRRLALEIPEAPSAAPTTTSTAPTGARVAVATQR